MTDSKSFAEKWEQVVKDTPRLKGDAGMTDDKSKVSPRPLGVEKYCDDEWLLCDDDDYTIGTIYSEADANDIAHCVNNFDALVQALEWALDVLNTIQPSMTVPDKDIEMLVESNQTLDAAKGEPK